MKLLIKAYVGIWEPIPRTKYPGGQRRRKGNEYEYRYPEPGGGYHVQAKPHAEDETAESEEQKLHDAAAQALGSQLGFMENAGWRVVAASKDKDPSGTDMAARLGAAKAKQLARLGVELVPPAGKEKKKPEEAKPVESTPPPPPVATKPIVAETVGERKEQVPSISFEAWAKQQGITLPTEAQIAEAIGSQAFPQQRSRAQRGKEEASQRAYAAMQGARKQYEEAIRDGSISMKEQRTPLNPENAADQAYARVQAKRAAKVAKPKLVVPVAVKEEPAKEGDSKYETTGYVFGSRAELWALRNSGTLEQDPKIAYQVVTREAVLGGKIEPTSFLAEKEAGTSPEAAFLKYSYFSAIQKRPPDSPEARELFSETIMMFQKGLGRCRSADDFVAWEKEIKECLRGYEVAETLDRKQIEERGYAPFFERSPIRLGSNVAYGDPEYEAWHRAKQNANAKILDEHGGTAYTIEHPDGKVTFFRTASEATQAVWKKRLHALGPRVQALIGFTVKPHRYDPNHLAVNPATGSSRQVMMRTAKEIQAQAVKDAIAGTSTAWDWAKPPQPGEKTAKLTATKREDTDYRTVIMSARLGEVVREGGKPIPSNKGISAPKLKSDLNLKEVEYGNWASDDDRQWHTEAAHAALCDLADFVGIDRKQVSLEGRLSLGFGSRGHGFGVAHYEPSTNVINLTKLSGKGSLAHEWGHFLDFTINASHNPGQGKTVPLTDLVAHGAATGSVPKPIVAAVRDVMHTISRKEMQPAAAYAQMHDELSAMRKRYHAAPHGDDAERAARELLRREVNAKVKEFNKTARSNDFSIPSEYAVAANKMGDYWARPHELFARSWESFVEDELKERGQKSTYLVQGTAHNGDFPGIYPGGEHRKKINEKMRALISVLKESDQFKKAMQAAWDSWLDSLTNTPLVLPKDMLEKGGAPIGTVHDWAGGQFRKDAPGQWDPVQQGAAATPLVVPPQAPLPGSQEFHTQARVSHVQQALAHAGAATQAKATGAPTAVQQVGPIRTTVYQPDPHAMGANGITKAARVGICGDCVMPPPAIPRMPNLSPKERAAEQRFANAFERDPDPMTNEYLTRLRNGEIGDAPNVFSTDDAKLLSPDYNPQGQTPEIAKQAKSTYNVAVHQTANAVAKRAFLRQLDDLAKLPVGDSRRTILVTSGGVASGKGYALGNVEQTAQLARTVGAVWDAAGEQNGTENPWVLKEAQARGLQPVFAFVDADPHETWTNPERGVIERAQKKGRMVDARLFADSYGIGAKNFKAFHDQNRDKANFIILSNRGQPQLLDEFPAAALQDSEVIYANAAQAINAHPNLEPSIRYGATIGHRIWGAPTAAAGGTTPGAAVGNAQGGVAAQPATQQQQPGSV